MKIKILDVAIEHVKNGKKQYSKAQVAYSHEGQARTQNIISFANPSIFAKVQEKVGQEVEVTITKNAAGYNEWASLDDVSATSQSVSSAPVSASPAGVVRTTGSNYETPEERARKQVYIVKQSSITAALTFLKGEAETPEQVLEVAQVFVDYVFKD